MKDICKTVNNIAKQPIKLHTIKEGTILKRNVLKIDGTAVKIESQNIPGELVGSYVAWIDHPNLGESFQRLLQQGGEVTTKIQLVENRWECLSFKVKEPEQNSTQEEIKAKSKEYVELGGDY